MPLSESKSPMIPRKKSVYYWLTFLSLVGLLAMGAFFNEGIAFFSDHPTTWMNDAEFFITFAVTVLTIACFLVLAHRNFHIGFHWPLAILFGLLFIGNTIGLFNLQLVIEHSPDFTGVRSPYLYTVSAIPHVRFIASFAIACVYLYLFFAVLPKVFQNVQRLYLVCYGVLLAMVAAIIYSLIVEHGLYTSMFTSASGWPLHHAQSFTNNPNTFSFFFSLGAIAVALLHNRKARWWWLLIMCFIAAIALFHASGTGAVCTCFTLLAFFTYRFVLTVRLHKKRNIILYSLFIAATIAFSVMVFVDFGSEGGFIRRFYTSVRENILGINAVNSRVNLWETIISQLDNPMKWIFGLGDQQVYFYFGYTLGTRGINEIFHAHNGFLHQVYAGGILRLTLYVVLIVRFYVMCAKRFNHRSRLAWPCAIGMTSVLIRSLFETNSFLALDTISVVTFLLLILPIEVEHNLLKHPERIDEEAEALPASQEGKLRFRHDGKQWGTFCFLFITPIVSIALGAMPIYSAMGYLADYLVWPYYVLWIEFELFFPLLCYGLGSLEGKKRAVIGGTFIVFFLASFALGLAFITLAPWVSYAALIILFALTCIAFALAHKCAFKAFGQFVLGVALPFLAVAGILIMLSSVGYFIPTDFQSIYNPIMLSFGIVVSYFLIMYLPFMDCLTKPINERWAVFECQCEARLILKQLDEDAIESLRMGYRS